MFDLLQCSDRGAGWILPLWQFIFLIFLWANFWRFFQPLEWRNFHTWNPAHSDIPKFLSSFIQRKKKLISSTDVTKLNERFLQILIAFIEKSPLYQNLKEKLGMYFLASVKYYLIRCCWYFIFGCWNCQLLPKTGTIEQRCKWHLYAQILSWLKFQLNGNHCLFFCLFFKKAQTSKNI